jgi:patatin-related protein
VPVRLSPPALQPHPSQAIWFGAAALAVAVAGAVVPKLGLSLGITVGVAAAAAAVPILIGLFKELRTGRGKTAAFYAEHVRSWSREGVRRVREVSDPVRELGIKAAVGIRDDGARKLPAYVTRTRDAELDEKLKSEPFVLVVGDSAAGKSRSAYEAMRRNFADRALIVPAQRNSLNVLVAEGIKLRDAVVWLDDLEIYLGSDGLNVNVLDRLCGTAPGSVTVLATMRAVEHAKYGAEQSVPGPERQLLLRTTVVRLDRTLDADEQRRAFAQLSDKGLRSALERRQGLGEYVSAGPPLVDRFEDGWSVNPLGAALVRAAVDLRRMGIRRALTRPTLVEVASLYADGAADGDAAVEEGFNWATSRIYGASALLSRAQEAFLVSDYIVDHVEREARPIPDRAWDVAVRVAPKDPEALGVSTAAHVKGDVAIAEREFSALAEESDRSIAASASIALGTIFAERGDRRRAEPWLRKAAEAGRPEAVGVLSALLARARELRIAFVCSGGLSRAVYTHGVTSELHRVVAASAALERDQVENPFPEPTTEHVYWNALSALRASSPDGTRTSVLVDVISATSLDGVNGIYLAKALASNRSQEPLRDLWLERGSLRELLPGPRWLPPGLKLPWAMSQVVRRSGLRPERLAYWLYDVLTAMDEAPAAAASSLVPKGHALRLFVALAAFYGRGASGSTRRHVVEFRHDGTGATQFDRASNGVLAFVALASAATPGVLSPINWRDFVRSLGGRAVDAHALSQFFSADRLAGIDPELTYFLDGATIGTAPFTTVMAAVDAMTAAPEADRLVLYIEPEGTGIGIAADRPPTSLEVVTMAQRESVREDLAQLERRRETVRQIRDLIERSFPRVQQRVDAVAGAASAALATADEVTAARHRATAAAGEALDLGAATYLGLRVASAVAQYTAILQIAQVFPVDSAQASFLSAVIRAWAQDTALFAPDVPTPRQRAFLDTFDLAYDRRRVRFVYNGIGWQYRSGRPDSPPPGQLDYAKARLHEMASSLAEAPAAIARSSAVHDVLGGLFEEPEQMAAVSTYDAYAYAYAYAAARRPALDALERATAQAIRETLPPPIELDALIADVTRDWSHNVRTEILVRYLGFPWWDNLILPIAGSGGLGEHSFAQLLRVGPGDATLLAPPNEGKLRGVPSLVDRRARENDYLWGRLDTSERLVSLLLGDEHPEHRTHCLDAFRAVVESEKPALRHSTGMLWGVERQLDALSERDV